MHPQSAIVSAALALRRSHPAAPALDVLALVLQGRQAVPADFGADGLPPAPFALLVAEAFDTAMTPDEWREWCQPGMNPKLLAGLLSVWTVHVWPRFAHRFGLVP